MRYQHKWQDAPWSEVPPENQANLEACIERSVALGINHIETARGYGSSEMQLGRILPRLPREKIIVQTKVGPDADPRVFRENFEKSLGYLGLSQVDLLSIHGINNDECLRHTMRKGGCLAAAREFQKSGRTRFVGFSTHGNTRLILETIRTGEFDYVNLHWYYVNHLNWPAVLEAGLFDMGVFIISPNDKGGKLYEPSPKLAGLCQPLSPMAFNDLYCLAQPEVHTLSLGAARPGDFDEHVAALGHYAEAKETMAPIAARLDAALDEAVGSDFRRHWHEGLPEWEDAPALMNVLEIARLWMYAKGLDLLSWGQMRYNLLGNGGHWFPGKNAAALIEGSVTDAEIRESCASSPFAGRIPGILREAHAMFHDAPVKRLSEE
jgi:hypothetical protein